MKSLFACCLVLIVLASCAQEPAVTAEPPERAAGGQATGAAAPSTDPAATALPLPTPTVAPAILLETVGPTPATPTLELSIPAWLAAALGKARRDLALRTGVAETSITVVSLAGEEFAPGNLGCPGSVDERPIPALVSGTVITLEAGGSQYRYHAHGSEVVYCGEQ